MCICLDICRIVQMSRFIKIGGLVVNTKHISWFKILENTPNPTIHINMMVGNSDWKPEFDSHMEINQFVHECLNQSKYNKKAVMIEKENNDHNTNSDNTMLTPTAKWVTKS